MATQHISVKSWDVTDPLKTKFKSKRQHIPPENFLERNLKGADGIISANFFLLFCMSKIILSQQNLKPK